MEFSFSDEQEAFRDAVRQVLSKECTTADLRAAYARPEARSARWTTLAELGVVGLSAPEPLGGLGLGMVDLVAVLEEAGTVALPEPLVETTALAAPLLARLAGAPDTDGRLAPWLRRIAAGEVTAAVDMGRGRGAGTERPVPVAAADGADLFVLSTVGPDGPEVHLLDAGSVVVEPVASLDPSRRLGIPVWQPTGSSRIAAGAEALACDAATADRAAVGTAAELLGLAERMIRMAAGYATERRQFGRAIGSFQAVKHLLAGAQVRLEFARPLVYAAAWALDEDDPLASRSASAAKAAASDAASEAARVALQVHGAIGYTWECDLHLFLKRTWALAAAWGSAAEHRRRVLHSLLEQHRRR